VPDKNAGKTLSRPTIYSGVTVHRCSSRAIPVFCVHFAGINAPDIFLVQSNTDNPSISERRARPFQTLWRIVPWRKCSPNLPTC
jgi:hypothetical protein